MQRAQRSRELIGRSAVHIFHAPAGRTDRVMVMACRLAEHIRGLAFSVGSRGDVATSAQPLERSIDGRKRDARARALEAAINLSRRKKPRLPREDFSDPLARARYVIGSNPHAGDYLRIVRKSPGVGGEVGVGQPATSVLM